MNDIQLRLRCIELASQLVGKEDVMAVAKEMFDWISQGAWPSDLPRRADYQKSTKSAM